MMTIRAFAALLAACCVTSAVAGDLTPPGAPGPTMKTLDEVEPSIPIAPLTTPGDGSAVYVISQPGAYHLTGNLQGVAQRNGIAINASGVTLDLRGFEVVAPATDLLFGIAGGSGADDIVIRNGTVRGWNRGVNIFGARARLEQVRVIENQGSGVLVDRDAHLIGCVAEGNGGNGISILAPGGIIESCIARANALNGYSLRGHGFTVRSSVAEANDFSGFVVFPDLNETDASAVFLGCASINNIGKGFVGGVLTIEGCETFGNDRGYELTAGVVRASTSIGDATGVSIDGAGVVEACTISNAVFNGVELGDGGRLVDSTIVNPGDAGVVGGAGVVITGTTIIGAGDDGVRVGASAVITGVVVDGAGGAGIEATSSVTITGCVIEDTTGDGVLASIVANIRDCTVRTTGGAGINVNDSSSVVDNTINNATTDGVRIVSRTLVRGNTIDFCGAGAATGYGVNVTGSQNRIEGNALTRADSCIRTAIGGNAIIGNSLSGWFSTATSLSGSNSAGPFLTSATMLSSPHPQANILH